MFKSSDDRTPADRWETWQPRALIFIFGGAIVGTIASFYESFSGLVGWFHRIGFTGDRAVIAPAMINLVGVVADVVLLVLIVQRWDRRHKVARGVAWGCVVYGLVLSIIGNAGRDGLRHGLGGWFIMAWDAAPPVSLALLMILALIVVKLWFTEGDETAEPILAVEAARALVTFAEHVRAGTLPTWDEIRTTLNCGQRKAGRYRALLADAHRDLAPDGPGDAEAEVA